MRVKFLDIAAINQRHLSEYTEIFTNFVSAGELILGDPVSEFENKFAEWVDCKYAVGVGNGLDALIILLKANGIGEGDSVIVPSNTYIATWLAVSSIGAEIIPVEPQSDFNINPKNIRAAIRSNTKAILCVHLYGKTASMDEINDIAEEHGLLVFEDAAQAHGAVYKGKFAGNLSHGAGFSFYPGKNLGGLGDGGAITTNDPAVYEFACLYRNYGSKIKYVNEIKGQNSRLDGLQAKILLKKLEFINGDNEKRKLIAQRYLQGLKQVHDIELPEYDDGHVWHLFVIKLNERTELKNYLAKNGIETLYHYPIAPHLQKAYSDENFNLPISEDIHQKVLSLPIGPTMSFEQVDYVIGKIKEYYN